MYFNQKQFGERLQDARQENGLTQEELAEALGIGSQHISRMERGVKACSIDLLLDISCTLGVSTDYLLMGKKESVGEIQTQIIAAAKQIVESALKL